MSDEEEKEQEKQEEEEKKDESPVIGDFTLFTQEKSGMETVEKSNSKLVRRSEEERRQHAQTVTQRQKPTTTYRVLMEKLEEKGLHPFSNIEIMLVLAFGFVCGMVFVFSFNGEYKMAFISCLISILVLFIKLFAPQSDISKNLQRWVLEYLEKNAPRIYESISGNKRK